MAFESLITGVVTNATKAVAKLGISTQTLSKLATQNIAKLNIPTQNISNVVGSINKVTVPTQNLTQELQKINEQKKNISLALNQIKTSLTILQKIVDIVNGLTTTISAAIAVIKAIPIPTSTPPGVGIPLNVITTLSDTLNKLSATNDKLKNNISTVPASISKVNKYIDKITSDLQDLDTKITSSIEKYLNTLSEAEKKAYLSSISSNPTSINLQPSNQNNTSKV
jgi:chromosome segregation ATPase